MSTMGDQLKLKMRLKQAIENHLYGAFDSRIKQRLNDIIDMQNSMSMHAAESFTYKGKRYIKEGYRVHVTQIRRLVPELEADMDKWLEDVAAIEDYERPVVMGYVQTVLNSAKEATDYLKLFPSALTKAFPAVMEHVTDAGRVSLGEAEDLVVQHADAYRLLKIRLMTNLLGVD